MNEVQRAREILDVEIQGLQRVRDQIGEPFSRAVDRILERITAGGKIVVTGMGKSLHIGHKIAATLTSTGTPSFVLHPAEAMHGDLGMLSDGDVLLALSYTGASEELLSLVPIIKRRGILIVAITGEPDSPLARFSEEIIPATVDQEACPFNMAPTTSTTAMLALGDALAMVLLEARGFQRDDYASLHPGGAIGRALLLRIEDIMRTGPRMASVSCEATVKDAVLAMTSARAGSVAVLDNEHRLLGIFTDGDLRRHITDPVDIAQRTVSEVMTRDPVTLSRDALAVDALGLFEKHAIDDLVVVDEDGRAVGLVDIQDLPKLKIL